MSFLRSPCLLLSRTCVRSLITTASQAAKVVKKKDVARKALQDSKRPQQLEAVAYCLTDRYDLSSARSLLKQDYALCEVPEVEDALVFNVKDKDARVFVFEVGAVVFWNLGPEERKGFLQRMSFPVDESTETESMDYRVDGEVAKSRIGQEGDIILSSDQNPLDQYSVSHAMSLSVKLATYESNLDRFAQSVQYVAESMAAGQKLTLTRRDVFQKIGKLFKLRHDINLGVDLLDTPDFYWDRQELETLFRNTCGSLSINRRTKLMNERLSYCYELMELLTSHLNEEHNTKLEWMIIWLIAIEVVFEVIHFADKFYAR